MKGDFSRDRFDPNRHYTAVLMQQGRVQLDADWNEQQAINQHRDETEAADVIGACGAPRDNAGFVITTDGTMLFIGKGRYYVNGILCENGSDKLAYDDQATGDLPGASIAKVLEELNEHDTSLGLVYLDVWKRHVTFREDGLLLEKALGEPDTTTRVQTVWQVRVLPVSAGDDRGRLNELIAKRKELQAQVAQAEEAMSALSQEITAIQAKLASLPPGSPERAALEQLLRQLNLQAADVKKAAEAAQAALQQVQAEIAKLTAAGGPDCADVFKEWDALPTLSTGKLNARTQAPANQNNPCLPPPSAGYRRLENQLYRVEIHTPGPLGTATFKWSRDNGTVVTSIEKISGNTITVHDLGRDDVLGFKAGDWVEITDDALELNGLPGQLAQINPPNEATRQITLLNATPTPLANTPDGVDKSRHPKLRRWDQVDAQAAPADAGGVKTSASFVPLEDGVEVQFSAGEYRSGDYWLIPARTATGEIEWPPYAVPNVNPIAQPARGIQHHYCRLALVQLNDGVLQVTDDCRHVFCPLTEAQCEEAALHVIATNWVNDDLFPLQTNGSLELRITLDGAPDPQSVNDASVVVAVEFPFSAEGQNRTPGLYQLVIIEGKVSIDPADKRVIVWRYDPRATPAPERDVLRMLAAMTEPEPAAAPRQRRGKKGQPLDAPAAMAAASRPPDLPRVNVTLKGHLIWRAAGGAARARTERHYLDGQAFGQPGLRSDNKTPRTALTFPTGAGARARDFESWMYVGAARQSTSLRVASVTFMRVTGQPSSAGTVTMPVPAGSQVKFKAGEQVRFIDIAFSRPIIKIDQPDVQKPQSVAVLSSGLAVAKVLGVVSTLSESVIRFEANSPELFVKGAYQLAVLGNDGDAPAIQAADDKSNLDGDFNGQAGGNFVLPFVAE